MKLIVYMYVAYYYSRYDRLRLRNMEISATVYIVSRTVYRITT